MKLRNKKTGKIINEANVKIIEYPNIPQAYPKHHLYNSLAKLNEEWEDYEEAEGWCVTMYGGITRIAKDEILISDLKEIGNYFNDKESAYDALDKLKAWKRLKDKGFRFDGYDVDFEGLWVIYPNDTEGTWCLTEDKEDLELLFGGKE